MWLNFKDFRLVPHDFFDETFKLTSPTWVVDNYLLLEIEIAFFNKLYFVLVFSTNFINFFTTLANIFSFRSGVIFHIMDKTSGYLGEGVWDSQIFLGCLCDLLVGWSDSFCDWVHVQLFSIVLDGSDFMTLELNQQLADL